MYNSDRNGEKIFNINERTLKFGVRIIKLIENLPKNTSGYAIGNQLVRSGTGIGANIEEAQNASSRKEFIRGITIALKEARETQFWLRLIIESGMLPEKKMELIVEENREIIKILITIIKSSKKKLTT